MESMAVPGREPARPLGLRLIDESPRTLAMDNRGLHEAITIVAETGSFDPLFSYFADDIELRISVALQSPATEEPVDVFSSSNRIVACRYASVAIAGGLAIRDECALLFDIS